MIYVATVKHYEEWDNVIKTAHMFIAAESIVKAVQQISDYYGENCLEDITLAPFSPDNFLFVGDEFDELFHDFALHAGDNVVW